MGVWCGSGNQFPINFRPRAIYWYQSFFCHKIPSWFYYYITFAPKKRYFSTCHFGTRWQVFEWDDWSHKNFFRIFQALLNLVMAILIVENVYFVQKRAVEKRCQNVHFENLQLWGALARDWLMRLVKKNYFPESSTLGQSADGNRFFLA